MPTKAFIKVIVRKTMKIEKKARKRSIISLEKTRRA